jgi:hypothetical protein
MSDTDLEALRAQYESDNIEDEEHLDGVTGVDPDEADADDVDAKAQDEAPPGLVETLEEWVALGKDPAKFRGRKAYEAEYKRIQEVKELKASVKGMAETLKATVEAIADRETKAEARHRKELEQALEAAKDIGDIDAALDATQQLNDLNKAPKAQARREHPVISGFLEDNVVLESPEIKVEFERIYNGKLRADGVGANDALSEASIRGYLRSALDSVKSIYPEKFASQKINRQAPARGKTTVAASKTVDVTQQLKSYKVAGVSKQNESAAIDIYNSLMKTSPNAAKIFAENLLSGE